MPLRTRADSESPFLGFPQDFGITGWRLHDLRRTVVSGMARLGVPPHVADKILNHQAGTISGVAAVYQRHEFLAERKEALDCWGAHVGRIVEKSSSQNQKESEPAPKENPQLLGAK